MAIPRGRVSFLCKEQTMLDKDQKEALQIAKELTAKLIEVRSVTQSNIGDVFPNIFRVVYKTILEVSEDSRK